MPQWIYWQVLSDLQMGVANIALYGNNASVAAEAVHMGQGVGEWYQQESEAAFEFAAKYVGGRSSGAWVAFRESVWPLYKNMTDYEFDLSLTNAAECRVGLDVRTAPKARLVPVVPNKTFSNQSSIGPWESRYGAWARRFKPGVVAELALAEGLRRRLEQQLW